MVKTDILYIFLFANFQIPVTTHTVVVSFKL